TLGNSLIGELKTIDTSQNLLTICQELGLPPLRIKYLGGLHVLLQLENDTHLNTVLSTPSLTQCLKSQRPWNKNFRLENRLTWISIEGLPPQAWHEAAFTRIARIWGDVIYPENCLDRNNNLVSGKVCILTKNMDLINHNMPIIINEVHTCVRIREIPGECNVFFTEEKLEDSDTEEDYNTNPNIDTKKNAHNEDEDDDNDLFDDSSDCDMFLGEELGSQSGGWIKDDVNFPVNNSQRGRSTTLENSNTQETCGSQTGATTSPISGNYNFVYPSIFVPETQIEELSPSV
ncbi:RNA-directed DNA polymerase, eukaryota, partial [Tanacetum coccineum]